VRHSAKFRDDRSNLRVKKCSMINIFKDVSPFDISDFSQHHYLLVERCLLLLTY